MRQRLLVVTTVVFALTAWAVHTWLPRSTRPTRIPTATIIHDGQRIASFASYANLRLDDPQVVDRCIAEIRRGWHPGGFAMLIEAWRFQPSSIEGAKIVDLLRQKSGQMFDGNYQQWQRWLWSGDYQPHPQYAEFKSAIYASQDYRFPQYFQHTENANIRLDEIVWGGVVRDGIPPLKNPTMMPAHQASYLADSDVVFGVVLGGDARCYPKRILAWHEMFKDTIGGESICGVYCTLCGSLVVYRTQSVGTHHELGTSGFLYRSNKLMYDHATKSLWSTLLGQPVVGKLVDQGIKLRRRHVVTSTWGQWKKRYPQSTVLSIKTGYWRDYGEGAAYRDYFATQDLMFQVPSIDDRLPPKEEILALRDDDTQLAIATELLANKPLHSDVLGQQRIVVLTDPSGASRVFQSGRVQFESLRDDVLIDSAGGRWGVADDQLTCHSDGRTLDRLPSHRAFWFGWYAQYPDTRLVQ